jgi:hypothetical protein
MAHRMCVACRIRSQTVGKSDDCVDELCPDCGSLLEPVDELSSIVGFRSINPHGAPDAGESGESGDQAQLDGRLQGIFSRRVAFVDLARFDAECDEYGDGEGLSAGAVSLPWPDASK